MIVRLLNFRQETNVSQKTKTTNSGQFTFPSLAQGQQDLGVGEGPPVTSVTDPVMVPERIWP
jgi:hypothetical protein